MRALYFRLVSIGWPSDGEAWTTPTARWARALAEMVAPIDSYAHYFPYVVLGS